MSKSCANCGAEILEGASVCDNCGMSVSEPPTSREAPTRQAPAEPPPPAEQPTSNLPSSREGSRREQPTRRESPPLSPPSQPAAPSLPPPPPVGQPPISVPPPPRGDAQHRWKRYWAPILLLLGFVLLGGIIYGLTRGTDEEDVAVLDLVGASSVEEAQRMAGGNFEVVEDDGVESREPVGSVVSQVPAAGEMAGAGSPISVSVSEGVNLPDVRGETSEEAVETLERVGFEVEEKTAESSAENEGYVTEQDPQGGGRETAEAGATVEITVGTGPAAAETDSAPASPTPKQTPAPNVPSQNAEEPKPKSPPPPPEGKAKGPKIEPPPPAPVLPPPPDKNGGGKDKGDGKDVGGGIGGVGDTSGGKG